MSMLEWWQSALGFASSYRMTRQPKYTAVQACKHSEWSVVAPYPHVRKLPIRGLKITYPKLCLRRASSRVRSRHRQANDHGHAETAGKWVYVTGLFFWLIVLSLWCLSFRQMWQIHIKLCSLLKGDKDQLGAGVATSHRANEWAQRLFHSDPRQIGPQWLCVWSYW